MKTTTRKLLLHIADALKEIRLYSEEMGEQKGTQELPALRAATTATTRALTVVQQTITDHLADQSR